MQNELYHHGIKNQKWGVRRFQNPDGTLTEEGKLRYARSEERRARNEARTDNFIRKARFTRGLKKTVTGVALAGLGTYALTKNIKEIEKRGQPVTVKNLKKIGGFALILGLGKAARGIGMMAFNPKMSEYDATQTPKKTRRPFIDELEGVSDDELKSRTNRQNLENEYYKSIAASADIGQKKTTDMMTKYGNAIKIVEGIGTAAKTGTAVAAMVKQFSGTSTEDGKKKDEKKK